MSLGRAVISVVAGLASRPRFHSSEEWQQVINTCPTIVMFLIVPRDCENRASCRPPLTSRRLCRRDGPNVARKRDGESAARQRFVASAGSPSRPAHFVADKASSTASVGPHSVASKFEALAVL
ncbi:low affinity iron permease family protein [Paraburkholderia dilworthii]|uniref:low affinity iron permease family protein n=1 Tax=Paraburkholderia dilworthii TaxID=948106 RepID=UPI000A06D4EC